MTKEKDIDLETLNYLKRLTKLDKSDIVLLESFIRDHIDPKCNICKTCPTNIRFALGRVKKWAKQNEL